MSAAIADPPAAPPAPTPAAPKPPGEESASFLESLHGEKQKPKPAPDKAVADAKAKADKEAADKAAADKAAKAAHKKPTPAKPTPPAEPDYEKIAEAAGRGVASAIEKAKPEPKGAPDPVVDLADDERELHEAYAQMEKDYPTQYKGLGKKYLDSLKAADEWEAKWLKDHPGEELDENNAEYKDFVEKNAIRYNDLHLHKSLAKMEAEKLVNGEREKGNAEVAGLKQKEREREAMPRIFASRVSAARSYFGELGAEFDGVLEANGSINSEAISKLTEADPLKAIAFGLAEQVEKAAHDLQIKAEEFSAGIHELWSSPKSFNGRSPLHSEIASFVTENENYLASLPADKQEEFLSSMPAKLREGRAGKRFATAAKYAELPANSRSQYFRLTPDDMAYLYSVEQGESSKQFAVDQAKKAKEMIAAEEKRVESLAEKRGWKKVDAATSAANPPAVPAPKAPTTPPPSPSPSGAIEPHTALPPGGVQPAKKNAADSFTAQWLG